MLKTTTQRRISPAPLFLCLVGAALSVLVASSVAAQPEPADRLPIVDRAIEHHGGDLYTATTTKLTISSRSGSFDIVSTIDGERFEHEVIGTTRDGEERRVRMTNDSVEQTIGGEPTPLDDEAAQRARDFVNARVYFPFLPFRLNDPGVYKRDLGLETWGGRDLHKVKVTFEPGSSTDANDEYLYWFDPESGRLEQFAYSFGTGRERGGLRLRKAFNHRRVGGILFFDSENWGVDGGGDLRVDRVTPELAAEMEKISTVLLDRIEVVPLAPAAASASVLGVEDFAWLAGRWVGEMGGELIEESWLAPASGSMLGVFRWMKADGVRVYELLSIESGDAGPVFWLRHFGAGLAAWEAKDGALRFELDASTTGERAVFDHRGAEQDLRLTYDLESPDALLVTLRVEEGGETSRLEFRYRRVAH